MIEKKVAIIKGTTGKASFYLAEFLLKKADIFHSIKRRSFVFNTDKTEHLYQDSYEKNIMLHLDFRSMMNFTNFFEIRRVCNGYLENQI